MAYDPLAPNLPPGSVFTTDHLAHIEAGITGARDDAHGYVDEIATQIQVGQVTDAAFDAAVDRAVADGRLTVETTGAPPDITITEIQPGRYQIEV